MKKGSSSVSRAAINCGKRRSGTLRREGVPQQGGVSLDEHGKEGMHLRVHVEVNL